MTEPKHQNRRSSRRVARRSGRAALGVISLLIVAVLAGIATACGTLMLPRGQRIARGVALDTLELGGMTRAQAQAAIEKTLTAAIAHQITLTAGADARKVFPAELGIQPESRTLADQAFAVGRQGPVVARVVNALRARWHGYHLHPAYAYDEAQARAVLGAIATHVNRPAENASGRWDDAAGRVQITPERPGGKLEVAQALAAVRAEIYTPITRRQALPETVTLPYDTVAPHITADKLAAVDAVLSSYTTSFATSTRNRASNVTTGAEAIDGTILMPGDVFSFNKIVGPRKAENGFVTAPVIINGQLKPGIGGGICQVSTTLYNAVLLANMQIVSRSHHSLPIHYAPLGRDATVSYGAIDFRFKNTTDAPVLVESKISGRQLTVRLLGQGPAPVVRLESSGLRTLSTRTITKKDATLPAGVRVVEQRGTPGKAVTTTRVIGDGPSAVREVVSSDRYLGEATIIRVGSGPAATEPTTAATAAATTN